MTSLQLSWLGTPKIEGRAGPLHLPTRKSTALLAFLSRSGHPVPREGLAALFWPEFDQTRANANLRRTLVSLNQVLGPAILKSDRVAVSVDPDVPLRMDVSEFAMLLAGVQAHGHSETVCPECVSRLEKAVSLYRGDFLEGFNLKDCPEFDDWQHLQREGLRSDLAFMLDKLTGAYLAHEEWENAILRGRQWVSLDRLEEGAQRRLIQAYALSGQKSAAIRQYEDCERWLQAELGQSPEKETIELYQQVRTGKIGSQGRRSQAAGILPREAPSNQPLLSTKLFVARRRPGLVSRRHLLDKLEEGAQRALTLISAPAGYGKTSLLSEWVDTLQKREADPYPWVVCWFSLDPADNDPTRFLNYLTTALAKVNPGVGEEIRTVIQTSGSLLPLTPLSMLINDLQRLSKSVLLVLDDYQFISNPVIHDGIAFLLEHLPVNVHLVIATRSDPPIPVALLRGRNLLTEIRANDLRFTLEETTYLLNQVFHLALAPDQIVTLEKRTEGWIAGLQMAAISMKDREDIAQFIHAFSGSHRFIIDYLAEEVLNRQPVETQEFLLRTSILERLCQPLCDFVMSGEPAVPGVVTKLTDDRSGVLYCEQNRLIQLEHSNLFIIPLDDERVWYRYHHLFADLLRTRLQHTSPALIAILHARASTWFEKNGWIEESIDHSLAAKDWRNSVRLVSDQIPAYLEIGNLVTIIRWIEHLPQEEIFKDPRLCALVAEVYSQGGKIDHIDPYLNKAEELLCPREKHADARLNEKELGLSPKEGTVIRSMIWILRGLKAVCSGDPKGALNFTHRALNEIPDIEPKELAVLYWVEGWAYRSLGDLDQALNTLTRATEFALKSGSSLRDTWTDLANVTRVVGKLHLAGEIITNSLQRAADRGIQNQGNLARDESFLSFIFLEQNELDRALVHADRAIAYTQWWPSHNIIATAYTSRALILLARADIDGAWQAIQKADQERKNRMMTPHIHSLVDVTLVQVWLARDEWTKLDPWASDQITSLNARLAVGGPIDEYLEMRLIMVVRVWMKKTSLDHHFERNEACVQLLTQLEENSRSARRVNSLVEILILKSSICFSQGKTSQAMGYLEDCLSMAEPGGYMRIFMNTGEHARALLSAYLQRSDSIHRLYAVKILAGFGGIAGPHTTQDGLPEPLTSREMEVLRLLAEGCSNRHMAEILVLAEGTIKFHVHNLLVKLQVDSRTQAIARAKDLHLVG